MKSKRILVALTVILLAVGAWFLFFRNSNPVRVAEMNERTTPPQDGLAVGPSVLGWSLHSLGPGQRDGYIYMRDARPEGGNKPLWEFALTTKRRLSDVTRDDLQCPFYGMNDPRGEAVFGSAWVDGAAILVPEGQVFFARLLADRSVIYVIRLAKEGGSMTGGGTMRIEYRAFKERSM